ncbi:RHS repeat-associated core domain-containing protein [Pseudomonas sp. MUP55]|uniref:RHS repeat domain-containing protein n=1 Tax=Pseudomonas sp. MUP55 TaxID=3087234 RepID=UPI002A5AD97F|nr:MULTISPECIES: RHS repeat-associated core domain-containing protein [unclassified Pseudomonas]WPN92871.1 RHS repeat-associated core domain-containing protein [Pseudomonas sp. MUP56]WPN98397.1 RHS repeat-associated core domain-containing protein [Pseudomonas sp. MUP55]
MSLPLHQNTPTLTAIDPRGLAVRTVAYYRPTAQVELEARISRQVFSASGFVVQQYGPRQRADEAKGMKKACHVTVYSLGGQPISSDSTDAGWRLTLLGGAGQWLHRWDARGAHRQCSYDASLRPVAVYEQAANDSSERCVERLEYAGYSTAEAVNNRCGRLVLHDGQCLRTRFEVYGLQGQVSKQGQRFLRQSAAVNWPLEATQREALLQEEDFVTSWCFSALGEELEQVDAKNNLKDSRYGRMGELLEVGITLAGGARQVIATGADYNASGHLITQRAGSGVVSEWRYDARSQRLQRLLTYRSGARKELLQDLTYTYDHVGNAVEIVDAAQPVQWSSNAQVRAVSRYEYDTLYQLIRASGRENAHNSAGPGLPRRVTFGAADDSQWRNYTRTYTYDANGNLQRLQHVPSSGSGYTRTMKVATLGNRSLPSTGPLIESPGLDEGFDLNGNQQQLERGQTLNWDVSNRLASVALVVRENAANDEELYGYDAFGRRVIKSCLSRARALTHRAQVFYLPGLEVRRDSASGEWLNVLNIEVGRYSVRILQWEKGRPAELANHSIRCNLSDHLGSSTLELDEKALLISQESYYPFGGTAGWAARGAIEASYKTRRYSGQELDATGLYYYGLRYYAPWLQRWISPDPAGTIDGLNRYRMVHNNPMNRVDRQGMITSLPTDWSSAGRGRLPSLGHNVAQGAAQGLVLGGVAALGAKLTGVVGASVAFGAVVAGGVGLAAARNVSDEIRHSLWVGSPSYQKLVAGAESASVLLNAAYAAINDPANATELNQLNALFFGATQGASNLRETMSAVSYYHDNLHRISVMEHHEGRTTVEAISARGTLESGRLTMPGLKRLMYFQRDFLERSCVEAIAHTFIHEVTHSALATHDEGGSSATEETLSSYLSRLRSERISLATSAEANTHYFSLLAALHLNKADYLRRKNRLTSEISAHRASSPTASAAVRRRRP